MPFPVIAAGAIKAAPIVFSALKGLFGGKAARNAAEKKAWDEKNDTYQKLKLQDQSRVNNAALKQAIFRAVLSSYGGDGDRMKGFASMFSPELAQMAYDNPNWKPQQGALLLGKSTPALEQWGKPFDLSGFDPGKFKASGLSWGDLGRGLASGAATYAASRSLDTTPAEKAGPLSTDILGGPIYQPPSIGVPPALAPPPASPWSGDDWMKTMGIGAPR